MDADAGGESLLQTAAQGDFPVRQTSPVFVSVMYTESMNTETSRPQFTIST